MLAVVLLAVCADPKAFATAPRPGEEPTLNGATIEGFTVLNQDQEVLAAAGAGYRCDTARECWEKCPEPRLGGSVRCSCTRSSFGGLWCRVTHYGPGAHPSECGGVDEDDVLLSCEDNSQLSLDCPSSVPRGATATCTVSAGTLDANSLTYEWFSNGNSTSPHTGQLGSQWGGTATTTRTIGVMVTGLASGEPWNEKHSVRVDPRGWWLEEQGAQLQYAAPIPGDWRGTWGQKVCKRW